MPCFYEMCMYVSIVYYMLAWCFNITLVMTFSTYLQTYQRPKQVIIYFNVVDCKSIIVKHFYATLTFILTNKKCHAILNYYLGLKIHLEKYDETMLPLLWLNECVNLISFVETSTYINITSRPRFFQCLLFLCSSKCNLSLSY